MLTSNPKNLLRKLLLALPSIVGALAFVTLSLGWQVSEAQGAKRKRGEVASEYAGRCGCQERTVVPPRGGRGGTHDGTGACQAVPPCPG
jgi:hypothetical protein